MPDLIGLTVAAAGNIAGGEAASALMGDTSYPKGGGIPGLTSTDVGKSGISPTVQVDPKPALAFFQQASNAYTQNAEQGLSYYNKALGAAQGQLALAGVALTAGYDQANATLRPLSQQGATATNQYMKMLGLDNPSPTQDIAGQVGQLGGYSELSKQIAAAEKLKDPTQRQAALDNINAGFTNAIGNSTASFAQNQAAQIAALEASKGTPQSSSAQVGAFYDMSPNNPQRSQILDQALSWMKQVPNSVGAQIGNQQKYAYNDQDPLGMGYYYDAQNKVAYDAKVAAIDKQISDIKNGKDKNTNSLTALQNTYDTNYESTPDYFGYTGDEKNAELAATPGYQFSLSQGQEAINRSAAAAGMFNSGNTLAALDQYSQGLAQQTYNQYMSNLFGMAQMGNQATFQIAANQAATGVGQANIIGQISANTIGGGQAALNTYTGIGTAQYNALAAQGQTYTQIQLANMQAQNNSIQGANQQSTALAGQASNYQLGMNNLNYQQQQSQQYAQGFQGAGQNTSPASQYYVNKGNVSV